MSDSSDNEIDNDITIPFGNIMKQLKRRNTRMQLQAIKELIKELNKTKRKVKVVYNDCYGGFHLSPLAIKILNLLIPLVNIKPKLKEFETLTFMRTHPYLTTIVEELGELSYTNFPIQEQERNSSYSTELKIIEVELGMAQVIKIDRNNGKETVRIILDEDFNGLKDYTFDLKYSLHDVKNIIQEELKIHNKSCK